jgi:hypothetical protein
MLMRKLRAKGVKLGCTQVGMRNSKGTVGAAARQDKTLVRAKKMQKVL